MQKCLKEKSLLHQHIFIPINAFASPASLLCVFSAYICEQYELG